MRRAVARGRILPQSLSTDRRVGRVSLKANLLYDRMWVNCDDQGRISGDPEEIKYAVCPNIDEISKADIPQLLQELDTQRFIRLYNTSITDVVQMLDWWDEQRLQWAWPSQYPPPKGWKDRLRYKPNPKDIVTENWVTPSQSGGPTPGEPADKPPGEPADKLPSTSPDPPPSTLQSSPSTPSEKEREKEGGNRRGRGNIPGAPGSSPTPSLTSLSLLEYFNEIFPEAFGREPDSREAAQLRDLGKEISAAGGATSKQVYDAFKEAAAHNKLHISYIRVVLLAWLGIDSGPK